MIEATVRMYTVKFLFLICQEKHRSNTVLFDTQIKI